MSFVFGSTPDALAQQRNVYDARNIQLAENDQRARQAAVDQSRENFIFAQRQDQENARQAEEFDQRNRQQSFQDALALAQAKATFADKMYTRGQDIAGEAENKRRWETMFSFNKGKEDTAKQEEKDKMALDERKVKLAEQKESDIEAERKAGPNPEDVQNVVTKANILVNAANPQPRKTHWFGNPDTFGNRKVLTSDEAFGHVLHDKEVSPFLDLMLWDNDAQQFVPKGAPKTPTAAPAPVFSAAPLQTPQVMASASPQVTVPPFTFNGSAVQPVTTGPTAIGAPPSLQPITRRPAQYYTRVNQLIGGGMDAQSAIAQAKKELGL